MPPTIEEVAKWVAELTESTLFTLEAIALEVETEFGPEFIVETEGGRTLSRALMDELRHIDVRFVIHDPAPKPKPLPDESEP